MDKDDKTNDAPVVHLQNIKRDDFIWTTSPHPHCVRRRAILEKYPQIQQLYGTDPLQIISVSCTVAFQFFMCYYISRFSLSSYQFFLYTFIVSATLNHSLLAALHESSHGTIVPEGLPSELFSIFATLPMGVPAAISFTHYHKDHHVFLGIQGLDPDLPTYFEARFFQYFWKKSLWIALFPFTYTLRPVLVNPKKIISCSPLICQISRMEIFNCIVIIISNFVVVYLAGWTALAYLIVGTFFSLSYHPFAGHFISEHYVFPGSDTYQETNSYYGFMNYFTYNLGYHVEHHDFPRIPGRFLPRVSQIAKEFYNMPAHPGWCVTLAQYLCTPSVTAFNRIVRQKFTTTSNASTPNQQKIPKGGHGYFWPKVY